MASQPWRVQGNRLWYQTEITSYTNYLQWLFSNHNQHKQHSTILLSFYTAFGHKISLPTFWSILYNTETVSKHKKDCCVWMTFLAESVHWLAINFQSSYNMMIKRNILYNSIIRQWSIMVKFCIWSIIDYHCQMIEFYRMLHFIVILYPDQQSGAMNQFG